MSVIPGLTDTQERYLETIYNLESEYRVARVTEIARVLHVKAPTVTSILKGLAEKGMVDYEPYGLLRLTEKGLRAGKELLLRHEATVDFLCNVLGVPAGTAEDVAGDIEHSLPAPVLCRLVQFNEHYSNRVEDKYDWEMECANLCPTRYTSDCIKNREAVNS
ncbi:MAG: metal-dependent transcriptional regulator [Alkalispirochaetaceae bacterium]